MGKIHEFASGRRASDYLVLAILAVGIWLRFDAIGFQTLWLDEYLSIRDSGSFNAVFRSFHSPGYFLLLKSWLTVFGDGAESGRSLSAFADSMTMIMVFLLAHRIFDRSVAICAVLLYAFAPMAVWYGRELRMYSLWGFTCLGAVYFLLAFLDGRGKKAQLAAFWIFSFAAFGSHYYSVFFLGSLAIGAALVLWLSVRDGAQTGLEAGRRFCSLFCVFPLAGIVIGLAKWDSLSGSLTQTLRKLEKATGTSFSVTLWEIPSDIMYFSFWGVQKLKNLPHTVSEVLLIPLLIAGMLLMARDAGITTRRKIIFLCYSILPVVLINTTGIRNYDRLSYPFLAVMMIILAYLIARTAGMLGRFWRPYAVFSAGLLLVCSWWPQLDRVLYQPAYPLTQACDDVKFYRNDGDYIAATAPYAVPLIKMVCGFQDEVWPFRVVKGQVEGNEPVSKLADHERVWIFFTHNWKGDPGFDSLKYLEKKGYELFYQRQYSPALEMVGLRRQPARPETVERQVPGSRERARF